MTDKQRVAAIWIVLILIVTALTVAALVWAISQSPEEVQHDVFRATNKDPRLGWVEDSNGADYKCINELGDMEFVTSDELVIVVDHPACKAATGS